jgi:hypothetical protein
LHDKFQAKEKPQLAEVNIEIKEDSLPSRSVAGDLLDLLGLQEP